MSDRIIEIHTGPAGPPGPAGPTTWAGITDKPPVFKPDVTDPALTATIAAATAGLPELAGLKRSLADASVSTGFQVLGDSTGNEAWEWPRLMLDYLAADRPDLTFQELLWSDTTQDFTRTTVQTGTAGVLYMDCDGTATGRTAPSTHLTGTIDVRVKVRAPDYSPATSKMIVGAMNTGSRSWALCINTGGVPQFLYSTDGTALGTMAATSSLPGGGGVADGADVWLRAVFTPDDGAGNRVAKFYLSNDGETWTQLGSTITTAGAVTLNSPGSSNFNIGGTAVGSYGLWIGRIYEVQIRDGENGPTVSACLPDRYISSGTSAPIVGAPVVTLVNGSHPGANLAYLNDATRLPKMTPHYGQAVVFLSESHNESLRLGDMFIRDYDAWVDAVRTRHTLPIVVLTQNPQQAVASSAVAHGVRRTGLLSYAPGKGLSLVDTYQTFLDNPDWSSEWMGDQVHPNALGQAAWWGAIRAEYDPL